MNFNHILYVGHQRDHLVKLRVGRYQQPHAYLISAGPLVLFDIERAHRHLELADDVHYGAEHRMLHPGSNRKVTYKVPAAAVVLPHHLLNPVRVALYEPRGVRTGYPVDLDAVSPRDEAEDIVTEHGVAAF